MQAHRDTIPRCNLSIVNKVATSNCKNGLITKY